MTGKEVSIPLRMRVNGGDLTCHATDPPAVLREPTRPETEMLRRMHGFEVIGPAAPESAWMGLGDEDEETFASG